MISRSVLNYAKWSKDKEIRHLSMEDSQFMFEEIHEDGWDIIPFRELILFIAESLFQKRNIDIDLYKILINWV